MSTQNAAINLNLGAAPEGIQCADGAKTRINSGVIQPSRSGRYAMLPFCRVTFVLGPTAPTALKVQTELNISSGPGFAMSASNDQVPAEWLVPNATFALMLCNMPNAFAIDPCCGGFVNCVSLRSDTVYNLQLYCMPTGAAVEIGSRGIANFTFIAMQPFAAVDVLGPGRAGVRYVP